MLFTCSACGLSNEVGHCQKWSCLKCPYIEWAQTIVREQQDLIDHLVAAVSWQNVREITWRGMNAVRDTLRGSFSYHKDGVHSLNHYIETRIIFPMNDGSDPDVQSFKSMRAFQFGDTYALDQVWEALSRQEAINTFYFFEDVEKINQPKPHGRDKF